MNRKFTGKYFFYCLTRIACLKVLLVLLLAQGVFAKTSAQEMLNKQISLRMEDTSLRTIVAEISKKSGVRITYNSKVLPKELKGSLVANNDRLADVLNRLLKPKGISYFVSENQIILQKPAADNPSKLVGDTKAMKSVDREVRGTVKDETGVGLPGVNVTVKGTTTGTMTDVEGNFNLNIPDGDQTLVFRFVGYLSQEVAVGSQNKVDIVMLEDKKILDEVVVVGYGVQKKANLAGAVSTIDSKIIEDRPLTSLASGLQGVSPGLIVTRSTGQPGSEGISIQIRGVTSANGNIDPLLILDGVTAPISVLQTLNPNDIESMSILKDAAAAIYGAQAAGGVILVTTKKGTNQKAQVDFLMMQGASKVINMPDRMSLLDEALFNNLAFANAGSNPPYNDIDLDNIRNNVPYIVNPNNPNDYIYYNQKSHVEELLKDYAYQQTYNLSVRGGNEKVNYFVSGGAFNQKGILKYGKDESTRYNGRLNLGIQLNKYVSVDTRVNYTYKEDETPYLPVSGDYGVIYEISRLRTRNPLLTPEGNYNASMRTLAQLKEGGFGRYLQNEIGGVGTIKIGNFIDGLTLRAVFGINFRRDDDKSFARTVPLWTGKVQASFLNLNNRVVVNDATRKNSNIQYLADYVKTFGGKHTISTLGGFQFEEYRYHSVGAGATNLISNDLPVLGLGDATTKTNSEGIAAFASKSLFGRLNYVFDDKYIAEVTYRWDENSKLAPDLRKKGFFGASAGWNMHREDWFSNALPIFSEFKLRTSWGKLGGALGDILGYYDFANLLRMGTGLVLGDNRTTYFYQGSIPSTSLSWETIETTNFGLDLGLLNNKIRFTGEYYIKYNRNMLTPQQLPAVLGVGTPRKNDGELKSWGWETEASYRDKIGKDVNFNIGFNLSDNKNKLISYSGNKVVTLGYNNLIEGQPIKTFYGYQTDGYYTSEAEVAAGPFYSTKTGVGDVRYVDQNGDGRLTIGEGLIDSKGDLIYLGTDQPRYTFGITGGLDWKGFDFSFFIQGVGKRSFIPNYHAVAPLSQSWRQPLAYHSDYWTPENPDALYPRPFYQGEHNYAASDKWTLNASYARLKNIQLGYSIPSSLASRLKVNKARVFITGQDLLTISKMGILGSVFDPESKNGVINDYPFFGNLSVGLNLNF